MLVEACAENINGVNIELVVLHRVLDNDEVLAAVEVLRDFLADFVLERSVGVHGFCCLDVLVLTEDPDLDCTVGSPSAVPVM